MTVSAQEPLPGCLRVPQAHHAQTGLAFHIVTHSLFLAASNSTYLHPASSLLPTPRSGLSFTPHIPPLHSSSAEALVARPYNVPSGDNEPSRWLPIRSLTSHKSSLHTAVRLSHIQIWSPTPTPLSCIKTLCKARLQAHH